MLTYPIICSDIIVFSNGIGSFRVPISIGNADLDHTLPGRASAFEIAVIRKLRGPDAAPQPSDTNEAAGSAGHGTAAGLHVPAAASPSRTDAHSPSAPIASPSAVEGSSEFDDGELPVIKMSFKAGGQGRAVLAKKTVVLNGKENVVDHLAPVPAPKPHLPPRPPAQVRSAYANAVTGEMIFTIDGVAYNARGEPIEAGGATGGAARPAGSSGGGTSMSDTSGSDMLDLTWKDPLAASEARAPVRSTSRQGARVRTGGADNAGTEVRRKRLVPSHTKTTTDASITTGTGKVSMQQRKMNWDALGGI